MSICGHIATSLLRKVIVIVVKVPQFSFAKTPSLLLITPHRVHHMYSTSTRSLISYSLAFIDHLQIELKAFYCSFDVGSLFVFHKFQEICLSKHLLSNRTVYGLMFLNLVAVL